MGTKKIFGVVGCGKLASALLQQSMKSKVLKQNQIWASTRRKSSALKVKKSLGVEVTTDFRSFLLGSDYLLLGIKPFQLDAVAEKICEALSSQKKKPTIISLLAGRKVKDLSLAFKSFPIVSVMTNTASSLGAGVSFAWKNPLVSKKSWSLVERMLNSAGNFYQVPESELEYVTILGASSPAFALKYASSLLAQNAGTRLSKKMRQDIIAQTLEGVAALLRKGLDPEKLIEQIATPGGCTEQGVLELERCHNSRDLQSAFEKAQRHIEQL